MQSESDGDELKERRRWMRDEKHEVECTDGEAERKREQRRHRKQGGCSRCQGKVSCLFRAAP